MATLLFFTCYFKHSNPLSVYLGQTQARSDSVEVPVEKGQHAAH